MHRPVTALAVVLAGALVAGCSPGTGSNADEPAGREISWTSCPADTYADGVECGTLEVPFDDAVPDAGTIELALVRLPAAGEAEGSVLFNPGGPGGSGNDFVGMSIAADPEQFGDLHESFDLVGFDPRGVGDSAPIDCVSDAWLDDHLLADPTPDTPDAQAAADAADEEFDAGCRQHTDHDLAGFDTVATARDMDHIRAALGDDALTFYGASYGTLLGATYATLFPDRVRAMVLDGAYFPDGEDAVEAVRTQVLGFEHAFDEWAAACEQDEACAFHAHDVSARWLALRDQLDQHPLTAADGRSIGEGAVVQGTVAALYSRSSWTPLANALARAEAGDGSALLGLADLYAGRNPDGTYDNINEANPVITCASGLTGTVPDDAEEQLAELRAAATHFGYDLQADDLRDDCAGLPVGEAPDIAYDGDAPILVIGGVNDPATPIVYAERLVAVMGANAGLVRYDGQGHTAVGESACVDDLAEQVLAAGTAPPAETTCSQDEPPAPPGWFTDLPAIEGLRPYDVGDIGGLVGFPDSFYVSALVAPDDGDVLEQRLRDGFRAAGWDVADRTGVPIGDGEVVNLALVRGTRVLAVLIIDRELVASPDLSPLDTFFPPGSSVVLYAAPT